MSLRPYYADNLVSLYAGGVMDVLGELADESVHAVVTDPPYELGFMGKVWDSTGIAYDVEVWREHLRILKPGGHLLAFGGSRTYHRLACAVEDVGFEIRDMIEWVYGSGFPKSLDVGKALDKAVGVERETWLEERNGGGTMPGQAYEGGFSQPNRLRVASGPATDAAKQWDGWGTGLKPAHEPVVVARKPFEGTVAENVLRHGTGALNVGACRVGTDGRPHRVKTADKGKEAATVFPGRGSGWCVGTTAQGRFPANLIHDGSDEVLALFPHVKSPKQYEKTQAAWRVPGYGHRDSRHQSQEYGDTGSAARFFYVAKASKAERGEGNSHPTVKPLALMKYLCKLVTPPGGTIFDGFAGSGTTLLAARELGFHAIGCDNDEASCRIAASRLTGGALFGQEVMAL